MAVKGLSIIGESINDSVPSTNKLFDENDIEGLKDLAKTQDQKGAAYIDVNVGTRPPEFMADMVRQVQSVTGKPLSIDTPDPKIARAGLEAYDPERAGGKIPILNSISPLRLEMLDLYKIRPFMPILLVSERVENGQAVPCRTPQENHQAAKEIIHAVRQSGHHFPNHRCIIDPAIGPIASDTDGMLKRLIAAMKLIHQDPDLTGVHMSVGLSNFTVMLPPKRADGTPVKSPLESAFLTMAMPLGLDMVIGSVKRKYQLLDQDHPAMVCLNDALTLDGFDVIMRIKEFYS
ncbi:MAG: dihydropteroate synthase [Planctomycetota bacterium]|jgi:5-methyltetrahydrofolate--homocysteine methyltransferase